MRASTTLFMISSLLCVQLTAACNSAKYLPQGHAAVPCIEVPKCNGHQYGTVNIGDYWNGKPFPVKTEVRACYNDALLRLQYVARGETLFRNDYTKCNAETWNQEVVEVFASAGAEDPTHYTEIEITPNGVTYVADIFNPYMNGTGKQNTMVNCTEVMGYAQKAPEQGLYAAYLDVPWKVIGGSPSTPVWRMNFFRVLMEKSVAICDPTTCAYGAWSPTNTVAPNFHVSTQLGVVVLV